MGTSPATACDLPTCWPSAEPGYHLSFGLLTHVVPPRQLVEVILATTSPRKTLMTVAAALRGDELWVLLVVDLPSRLISGGCTPFRVTLLLRLLRPLRS